MSVWVWRDSSHVPAGAHVVLALEHQRPGRADLDAVAAVDARRLGQRQVVLGRHARVEAAAGDLDHEAVLPLLAAGIDALVAEDALGVITDVEVVVDLDRLGDGGGVGAVPRRVGAVLVVPLVDVVGERQVDRRAEELEHHLAGVVDALRVVW